MKIPVIIPVSPSAKDKDLEPDILQLKFNRTIGIWKLKNNELEPIYIHIGKLYKKEAHSNDISVYYIGFKLNIWIIDLFIGFFFQFFFLLKYMLKRKKFIIFSSTPYQGLSSVLIRKITDKAILCTRVMGDTPNHLKYVSGMKATSLILEKIERYTLRNSDVVIVNSSFTKKLALKKGANEEKISYIPSPIFDFKEQDSFQIKKLREKYGQGQIILTVARLTELKGIQYLIKAFKIVKKEIKDINLVIVGDGGFRKELDELSISCGVNENVYFEGMVTHENIFKYFNTADIFVMPSIAKEGRPTVITEAGLSKKPVVATFEAGQSIIKDNIDGFLVPPKNEKKLAEKILKFIHDENKRKKFGEALYNNVITYYDKRNPALKELENRLSVILNDPE